MANLPISSSGASSPQYLEKEEHCQLGRLEDEERYQRYLDSGKHITDGDMVEWLDYLAKNAAANVRD